MGSYCIRRAGQPSGSRGCAESPSQVQPASPHGTSAQLEPGGTCILVTPHPATTSPVHPMLAVLLKGYEGEEAEGCSRSLWQASCSESLARSRVCVTMQAPGTGGIWIWFLGGDDEHRALLQSACFRVFLLLKTPLFPPSHRWLPWEECGFQKLSKPNPWPSVGVSPAHTQSAQNPAGS